MIEISEMDFSKPTEIIAFDYSFGKFISIFKKNYKISGTQNYDFIEFFNDVDPISAGVFIQNEGSKERANEILNQTFKQSIDNIQVGGRRKQKGGAGLVNYFQIFVFFLLAIAAVESGKAGDRLEQFKKETRNGKPSYPPIPPPPEQDYATVGWLWGRYSLTPEQKQARIADVAHFEEGTRIVQEAADEERTERDLLVADSRTRETQARASELSSQAELTRAQERVFSAEIIRETLGRLDMQGRKTEELYEQQSLLQETLTYFAIFTALFLGAGIAVGIYYFVKFYNKRPEPQGADPRIIDITPFFQLYEDLIEQYINSGEVSVMAEGAPDNPSYTFWTTPEISNLLNALARSEYGRQGPRQIINQPAPTARGRSLEIGPPSVTSRAFSRVSSSSLNSSYDDDDDDDDDAASDISHDSMTYNTAQSSRRPVSRRPDFQSPSGQRYPGPQAVIGRPPSAAAASFLSIQPANQRQRIPLPKPVPLNGSRSSSSMLTGSTRTLLDSQRSGPGSISSATSRTLLDSQRSQPGSISSATSRTLLDSQRSYPGSRGGKTVKKRRTRKSKTSKKRIRKTNKKSKRSH